MSTKQNWACALCGETFTRRSSGNRHNLNLHSGVSMIVGFMNYVIGVLNGKYKSPDPLATSIRRNSGINFLHIEAINQDNNMSYFNGERHDFKNNNSYPKYYSISESQDKPLFNNFCGNNAALIDSIIEKYEEKLKPFLSKDEFNKFTRACIIFPTSSYIDSKERLNQHIKFLDNFVGCIRISRRLGDNISLDFPMSNDERIKM